MIKIKIKLEKFESIPYGRQDINEDDIKAVVEILRSDFITQGSAVPTFENKLCDYTGAKYAIAVNSCTSALHIACLALGLGSGDVLWTSPITFVASANCALYCGASVDFIDIEPDTALISVEKLKDKLILAESKGKLPKIVLPVHFSGQPCDMKEIHALSKQYGFKIIEDAAHAIGAKYYGGNIGNCHYSDITVFSFHPVKIITTGEGGMAMTNDSYLADKMELLRSHGITRDVDKMYKNIGEPWYYEQIDLGFNYRMTDIQAALGISQMDRLDQFVRRRFEIVEWYNDKFQSIEAEPLFQKPHRSSAHHLYIIKVKDGWKKRQELYNFLNNNNIGVNLHYIPINQQPFFQTKTSCSTGFDVDNANRYYSEVLTLPLYPGLELEQMEHIVHKVCSFYHND